jgi:hypothetical protein
MLRSIAVLLLAAPCLSAADPSPILQVVRLKPGETKSVELALKLVQFRPKGRSGRDFLDLNVTTVVNGEIKETPVAGEVNGILFTGRYLVTPDFTMVWSRDKPELEFHAGVDMKKGMTDLRIIYRSFGGGDHVAGFRIIVE